MSRIGYRPPRDRLYLVHVDHDGDFGTLYLLDGRYGSRGGFRMCGTGWVADPLPLDWLTGSADHLDPVADRWARRRASQLGIDGPTFDRHRPSG